MNQLKRSLSQVMCPLRMRKKRGVKNESELNHKSVEDESESSRASLCQ